MHTCTLQHPERLAPSQPQGPILHFSLGTVTETDTAPVWKIQSTSDPLLHDGAHFCTLWDTSHVSQSQVLVQQVLVICGEHIIVAGAHRAFFIDCTSSYGFTPWDPDQKYTYTNVSSLPPWWTFHQSLLPMKAFGPFQKANKNVPFLLITIREQI